MKRQILVACGDTHGSHRLGLCNPEVEFQEEFDGELCPIRPELFETQKFLWWECWLRDIEKVAEIADGDDITVEHGGDIIAGTRYPSEWMTTSVENQLAVAEKNFEPWFKLPNLKQMYFLRGTGVHELGEGSASGITAKLLQALNPDVKIQCAYHYLFDLNKCLIDASHHGPGPGIRAWTRGNVLELYARSLMIDHLVMQKPVPNIILRHHRHRFVPRPAVIWRTPERTHQTAAFLVPPYSAIGDHGRKVTQSVWWQTIGMLVFEIVDGRMFRWHEITRTLDIRTREIVNERDQSTEVV